MEQSEFPILEFDPRRRAVIEPGEVLKPLGDMPERGVMCFFKDAVEALLARSEHRLVVNLQSEMGHHPVFRLLRVEGDVALFHCGVGAPLAAASLEELIAYGCRRVLVCGGAGVLDRGIAAGHLLVPTAAVRDEGTSYHYLPPSREVEPDPGALQTLLQVLQDQGVEHRTCKTWTTDAIYRETRARVARRRDEGCLTVEMEAAALFAVARFRGIPLAQLLYGGDDVSADDWDHRRWYSMAQVRSQVLDLAIRACQALA